LQFSTAHGEGGAPITIATCGDSKANMTALNEQLNIELLRSPD
jgi:hypothetical protein